MVASSGKQTCGQKHGNWHEERIPVSCTGEAKNGQFTVRVYTTLNSGASDESFGIDNAVLSKVTFKTITANIKKTFKNLPAGKYKISLQFIKIDSWDNEYGYVEVNGKRCWSKRMVASSGKQTCGQKHGNWHEERIP